MMKTQEKKRLEQLDSIKLLHRGHSHIAEYYTTSSDKTIAQENNYEPD